MPPDYKSLLKKITLRFILPLSFIVVFLVWCFLTPAGLLGKLDAIGYAVCHRIVQRSFMLDDRPLPLCARCTGMHLGVLFGLFYLTRQGKRGSLPSLKFLIFFIFCLLLFSLDGINSYINLIGIFPALYTTENWMRLFTGAFLGIAMAGVLYPIFNQSIWVDWIPEPVLSQWKQMAALILIGISLFMLVLSENPIFLYPFAILSTLDVMLVLTLIYTIIWVMITRKDNTMRGFNDLKWYLLAGLLTALVQIGIMDFSRFSLTGTWNGLLS